jgi:uncharacterized damage-inducible protein DinB
MFKAPPAPNATLDQRTDIPLAYDDRTLLSTYLDYVRLTVHAKCVGISEANAGAAPLATSPLTSISGLVSHLRWVEAYWIDVVFLGGEDQSPCTEEDPDREMRIGPERPIQELLDEYAAQCRHNSEVIAATDLDAISHWRSRETGEGVTLRWIVMHLIEETARHNGHIDLLREMADGVTGA